MDLNEYCLQAMTRERIDTMRADVQALALRAAARGPRRPVRIVLGQLLVRLGNRLLAGFTPARATA
jgi:hypothetical protein